MSIPVISSKRQVLAFLAEMQAILSAASFSPSCDFVFQMNRSTDDQNDEFTNANTLLALNYDHSDVLEELKRLTVEDYCESMVDNQVPGAFHVFYVFGKQIQGRQVYIKVRIKERAQARHARYVFCISFHFARHPITSFPYRKTNPSAAGQS